MKISNAKVSYETIARISDFLINLADPKY